MRIPICLSGETAASISHSLEGESQESSVMVDYLDVNVCVFQVQRKEPGSASAQTKVGGRGQLLSPQVPGRKKTGGRKGRSHSLKRKLSASAERRD